MLRSSASYISVFYHERSNGEVYRAQVVIKYSGTVEIIILAIVIFY